MTQQVPWAYVVAGIVYGAPTPFAVGSDPHKDHPGVWALAPDGVTVESGMTWDKDAGFGPAPVGTPKVPNAISDRQFAEQAAIDGLISDDEALAWAGPGTIPPGLLALVAKMPADQQFGAKMALTGAKTYLRNDPKTIALTTAFGWTDAERRAFWLAASAL